MSDKSSKQNSISGLAVLLVFGLFAVCILLVLLTGAGSYERLADGGSADLRTAVQLLSTRIRQCESPALLGCESFGDGDALTLRSYVDDDEYITVLYCHEGKLRELYTRADREFNPDYGEALLDADSLTVTEDDGLFRLTVSLGSERASITLSPRGEEAQP